MLAPLGLGPAIDKFSDPSERRYLPTEMGGDLRRARQTAGLSLRRLARKVVTDD